MHNWQRGGVLSRPELPKHGEDVMCDVLLAYVGEDAAQADALADALESLGLSVGDAHASEEEFRRGVVRIVIWSQAAARSRALIAAAERFIGAGETIIASLVDPGASTTEDLPVFDLSAWDGHPFDARLDPLLDVIRRMLIVAGRARANVIPAPAPAAARVSAGWLGNVPATPPHPEPWPAAMGRSAARALAAAAHSAPKRSIMASLVIGSFLAGALLTGSLDRMGALQATPSYAEAARPAAPAPVAVSEVAEAAPPEAASPVEPQPPARTVRRASRSVVPDAPADDYMPPPYRSWEQPQPQPAEQAAPVAEPVSAGDHTPPPYRSWD